MTCIDNKTLKRAGVIALTSAMVVITPLSLLAQTITTSPSEITDETYDIDGDSTGNGKNLENKATVTANFGGFQVDDDIAVAEVQIASAQPDITMSKVGAILADGTTIGSADVGEVIEYTFTIKNIGNVTLTDIALTDAHNGLNTDTLTNFQYTTCASDTGTPDHAIDNTEGAEKVTLATINVGETVTCTATYTVSQADIDNLQQP